MYNYYSITPQYNNILIPLFLLLPPPTFKCFPSVYNIETCVGIGISLFLLLASTIQQYTKFWLRLKLFSDTSATTCLYQFTTVYRGYDKSHLRVTRCKLTTK